MCGFSSAQLIAGGPAIFSVFSYCELTGELLAQSINTTALTLAYQSAHSGARASPSSASPLLSKRVDSHFTPPASLESSSGECIFPGTGAPMPPGTARLWSGARCDCIDAKLTCGPSAVAVARSFLFDPTPLGYVMLATTSFTISILLFVLVVYCRCVKLRSPFEKFETWPLVVENPAISPLSSPPSWP